MFIKRKRYYKLLDTMSWMETEIHTLRRENAFRKRDIQILQLPNLTRDDFSCVLTREHIQVECDTGSYQDMLKSNIIEAFSPVDYGEKVMYGTVLLERQEIKRLNQGYYVYTNMGSLLCD